MHCVTEKFTVGKLLVEKNVINEKPAYQRESAIWSPDKQQLFLDSIFNNLDVPKIYFHDLRKPGERYRYAVIDGKQRLQTVWDFLDDKIAHGDTFVMADAEGRVAPKPGTSFSKLDDDWKEIFKSRGLDIVLVQNAEEEDIEELFSRLNNGEPLSAAEKRNAISGVMTNLIREISKKAFFAKKLSFPDKRYQYRELAAKLLLIEHTVMSGGSMYRDLKKKFLDNLVKENKRMSEAARQELLDRIDKQLRLMSKLFSDSDPLLSKQASVPLYYLFSKKVSDEYASADLFSCMKSFLPSFHSERTQNLELVEEERDVRLLEFDRRMQQGTNDGGSLEERTSILVSYFLRDNPRIELKDKKRAFNNDERYAIYILNEKHCQKCKKLISFDEMDADHAIQHAHGGPTTVRNARCLCASCNREANQKRK